MDAGGLLSGLVMLVRHALPKGATRTITPRDDVVVTLWVERGTVEVTASLADKAELVAVAEGPCALPLGRGPLHVRNAGKQAALVFAALGECAPEPPRVGEAAVFRLGGGPAAASDAGTQRLINPALFDKVVESEGTWRGQCTRCKFKCGPGPEHIVSALGRQHHDEMEQKGKPGHRVDLRR